MAFLKKHENTAELLRIVYEDSDVTIATSNPGKIQLNFVTCDTGIVGEIKVRKKREQLSNISDISSEEWHMIDNEKEARRCGCAINASFNNVLVGPIVSAASVTSQHTMVCEDSVEVSTAKLDNEVVCRENSKLTQDSPEIQPCIHSNAGLPSATCSRVHSLSSLCACTTTAGTMQSDIDMHADSVVAQPCDHPDHRTPSVPNTPPNSVTSTPTTVPQVPELQFLPRKSKSAIELTTPSKEMVTDSQGLSNEPSKIFLVNIKYHQTHTSDCDRSKGAEEPSISFAVDGTGSGQRVEGKDNAKRKRVHARKSFRPTHYQSSSESDSSHRMKLMAKRRRRLLRNRVIQVVVKKGAKKAQIYKSKCGVGILQCSNNNPWEMIRRNFSVEGTSKSAFCESNSITRMTSKMENTHMIHKKNSMEKDPLTSDEPSSVEEPKSQEQMKQGTNSEEQANEEEALTRARDKSSNVSNGEQELQEQVIEAEALKRVSYMNSYVSEEEHEQPEHAEIQNPLDDGTEELFGRDDLAVKPVQDASSSIITQGQQQTDADLETEDDQCGDQAFGRFYRRRMAQKQTEDYLDDERDSSSVQSSEEMPRNEKYDDIWPGTPPKSSKEEFIHMGTEDDLAAEVEKKTEDQEEGTEKEKTIEHEEVEAAFVAPPSIESIRQQSTCSCPTTSYASIVETTSGMDSLLSPTASTCFSDANTKSVTTDQCPYFYDAFNESCNDENDQQVRLLMDNLNKTGFLASSVSDIEIPETTNKNALTATWRNSVHRPKWDETVDLCLVCGNQEFYVHRLVVVHYSRKLCRLLCKHILKSGLAVEVLGINPKALHTVIDWMYTSEINIQKNNVLDVFMAAVCLDVKKLQVLCINKMYNIVNKVRMGDYRLPDAQTSSRSVDIKKQIDIFRKRRSFSVSPAQSTDVTTYRQDSAPSYESPKTPEVSRSAMLPMADITSDDTIYNENNGMVPLESRPGSSLEESAGTEGIRSASTMSSNKWKKPETSDNFNRSTASWTPKQTTNQIAFQTKNGQEVSSAPLSKHCLVEKRVAQTESWHSSSAHSTLSFPREPASADLAEYDMDDDFENVMDDGDAAAEQHEMSPETSCTNSDKMSEPRAGSNDSRGSSVSLHEPYPTFGGSQKSLSERGASGGYGSDDSSSFTFEERPVPSNPSCVRVTVRTGQTRSSCEKNDVTEVVTIKKAKTTRITNFKKGNINHQDVQARNNSIFQMLMGAKGVDLSHEVNVVSPVQINKPAKLMQTYTLAMPKNLNSDRVLLFGGLSRPDNANFDEAAQTVHCYDVTSGKYDKLGKLPTPLFDAAACCYGCGVYLTGGISQSSITPKCPGKATTDVWYLDLLNPVWQKRNNMQQPRAGHCLVYLDGRIYAIGGADDSEGNRVTQTVEAYRPQDDIWILVQPLPVPLWRMGATCFNGAIWLCGGMTEPIQVKTNEIFIYSPDADRWLKHKTHLLKKVAMASLVDAQGDLVLVGGLSGSREADSLEGCALDTLDIYNNEKEEWNTITNMSDPRFISSVVVLGDQIVIIGGRNSRFSPPLKSVEIYGKQEGKWAHGVKALPLPLSNSAAVGLPGFRRQLL